MTRWRRSGWPPPSWSAATRGGHRLLRRRPRHRRRRGLPAAASREAVAVARTGSVVTIGIEPTHPATGFGYIHVGDAAAGRRRPARPRGERVRREAGRRHGRRLARDGGVPLERRDVRRPGLGAARPAGELPARAGRAASGAGGGAGAAGGAVAGADEDRDRPRRGRARRCRRTGRGGPRRLRLGRRGRLLLPRLADRRQRRPAGGQDPGLARPRPHRTTPTGWSSQRRAAPSPCWGWRTSSWSTPRTRCW